ncbi:bifunctional demethylmenaquinone methyltransferase/2-methoxy-6-polyprenyl-1,4-benzoquinol methylase UbiE [Oligoflexia bacterium]|nr:bifunctional demethylmenaquinone methyltransferase/2-methoxy-6-polyprenyl-1,4-benzoquinol methylase UbiE [Oligoflexia bacterium]
MNNYVHNMFADIADRYDLLNDVLSFGLHRLWRKQAVKFGAIAPGASILDLCCGTGDFSFALFEAAAPSGNVLGVDFVEKMLEIARRKKIAKAPQSDIIFQKGDATQLKLEATTFDYVTSAFGIRNVADTDQCLRESLRVLKPGGKILILEFGQPTLPVFSHLYHLYGQLVIPILGGLLAGSKAAYEYLPTTAKAYPSGPKFIALLAQAGFVKAQFKPILFGVAYLYLAEKTR